MKKTLSFLLVFLMLFLQTVNPIAYAFTDTKNSPFISKKYTHDDKFLNYEIINGIDVSEWQTSVDFKKVKAAGADFVFLRAAYRGYTKGTLKKDVTFDKYAAAAIKAGLDVGAYIYSQAITTAEAVEEANYILNIVKGYNITLPIVFDFEYAESADSRLRAANLSNKTHTNICIAFCEQIEKAGYTACVYANHSMLTNDMNDEKIAENYPIWLANYSISPTLSGKLYDCDYSYWQYASNGKVDGISGNIDCNFRYFKPADKVENLTVTEETIDKTTLNWNKIKGCYGYEIYRKNTSTQEFELIATNKGAATTTYTDKNSNGAQNTYKVRAISTYKTTFKGGEFSDELTTKGIFMANLSVAGTGYATFTWQVYPSASEYEVLRADKISGVFSKVATTDKNTTHYTDYTKYAFKTYYYMIRAIVKDKSGIIIHNAYTPVLKVAKPQPKLTSVILHKAASIKITWENTDEIHGTAVYRKRAGEDYKLIKTITTNSNTYIDTGLEKGVKYYYKVCNFVTTDNNNYYSDLTSAKSVTTLKAPTLSVTAGSSRAKISYTKPVGANGYEIYMKSPNSKNYELIKTTTKLTFTKKQLSKSKTYYFKVKAYRNVNGKKVYSAFSKTKKVKIL